MIIKFRNGAMFREIQEYRRNQAMQEQKISQLEGRCTQAEKNLELVASLWFNV